MPDEIDRRRIQGAIPLTYNDCPTTAPVATLSVDLLMVLSQVADSSTVELKDFNQPSDQLAGYAVGNFSPNTTTTEPPDSLSEAFLTGVVYTSSPTPTPLANFVGGYSCEEYVSWSFYSDSTTIVASANHVSRTSSITCGKTNAEPIYCTVTYDGTFAIGPKA